MLITGIEIGRSHTESLPQAPDFITMIANAIAELPGIPFDIELTQTQLNEILNKNAEALKPLTGAKLTISKDKTYQHFIATVFPTSFVKIFTHLNF